MGMLNTYLFFSRYQGATSDLVICMRAGTLVRSDTDQAFQFHSAGTALTRVPLIEREQTILIKAVSPDQQGVNVQVNLTHRIAGPLAAAQCFDFDPFPRSGSAEVLGAWRISGLVARITRSATIARIATMTLGETLDSGMNAVAGVLSAATTREGHLTSTGVEICDVCVLSVRPDEVVESALHTPLLEQLQSEADRAPYGCCVLAVEREQQISRTELASRLKLERRHADLVAREGQNARRQAEEETAADLARVSISAKRRNILSTAQAEEIAQVGAARNEVGKARLDALAALGADVLRALALHDLAESLPIVGQINITPDMLQGVLADLIKGGR